MKKKIIILLCIIVVIGAIFFAATHIFENKKLETSDNQKEENPPQEKVDEVKDLVTSESLKELSNTLDEKIYTDITMRLVVDRLEGTDIEIGYENDLLYLYHGNNKSVVSNFKEKIVSMTSAGNSCEVYSEDILLLTNMGNLYIISGNSREGRRFDSRALKNLNEDNEVQINLTKVNNDELKVLGITEYYHNKKCNSCSKGTRVVYTSDKKYRLYKDLNEIQNLENYIICGGTLDINAIIYKNGKIAIQNGFFLSNKFGNDLVIKEAYKSGDTAYIIDNTYYLYTLKKGEKDPVAELYLNSRILDIKKESNTMKITFESGKFIDIENYAELNEN